MLKSILQDSRGASVLLFVAALLTYGVTLGHGFVFDDNLQVLENKWMTDIGYLPEIFTSSVWEFSEKGNDTNFYRPMMHIVYMFNYSVFALEPWGYHLVNILFHGLNSVLLYFALRVFFVDPPGRGAGSTPSAPSLKDSEAGGAVGEASAMLSFAPLVGALVFALHPVNSEVVNWVAAIPELTFVCFLLLSFITYVSSYERGKVFLLISLLCFFLSIISKETAVAIGIFILSYDLIYRRRFEFIRYIPYGAVLALYMALRTNAVGGIIVKKQVHLTPFEAVINVFPLIYRYMAKLVAPFDLAILYKFVPHRELGDPTVLISIALTLLILIFLFIFRRDRIVLTSLIWIFVPLLPVLYTPAISPGGFAERYLYLSSGGFGLLLAYGFMRLSSRWVAGGGRGGLLLSAILVIILLTSALLSAKRSLTWKDDLTLWRDSAKSSPHLEEAHFNYGWVLHKSGDLDGAVGEYLEALDLEPYNIKAHNNLAIIYQKRGREREAIEHYRIVLERDPAYEDANYNIATLYFNVGDTSSAIRYYLGATRFNPDHESAHFNLAWIYESIGRVDEAVFHYREVIRLNSGALDARYNLALLLEGEGMSGEALREYRSLRAIDPGYRDVASRINNLGGN